MVLHAVPHCCIVRSLLVYNVLKWSIAVLDKNEFSKIRGALGKTQKKLAQLLCVSVKAIQSFEQGWRDNSPEYRTADTVSLYHE